MKAIFGKPFKKGAVIALDPDKGRQYFINSDQGDVKEIHNEDREDNLEDFKKGNVFYQINMEIEHIEGKRIIPREQRTKKNNTLIDIII